jgi:4-alpha-glucanotransferase
MRMAGLSAQSEIAEVIERTYELLAQAPSAVVTATLEDALAMKERPNMPGTTGERWPNWSMALPQAAEAIERDPLALTIARALQSRRSQR